MDKIKFKFNIEHFTLLNITKLMLQHKWIGYIYIFINPFFFHIWTLTFPSLLWYVMSFCFNGEIVQIIFWIRHTLLRRATMDKIINDTLIFVT